MELTNLGRQSLYSEPQIGREKIVAAGDRIREINRSADVDQLSARITGCRQLRKLIVHSDLVINCADEPEIDFINSIVSRTCVPLRIPHILCGGYDGHLSFVGLTVIPFKSPCWICYSESSYFSRKRSRFSKMLVSPIRNEGGTLAPIAAITGNIHALEAIKVLSRYAKPAMSGVVAEFDFTTLSITKRRVRRSTGCRVCGDDKNARYS